MGADNGPPPDGGAAIRVIDPSVVGARAGTPGQGVNQAAIAGLLTGAQDPVQLAQNASANNGSVPVAVGLGGGVPVTVVLGGPVGPDAAIHLRRYTQITQRQPTRGLWTATAKLDQLDRLKRYCADPGSLLGEQDPHRYLGQHVANTFSRDQHNTLYEGTIIVYEESNGNYGVTWDDEDWDCDNADVIMPLIEKWLVKTGQKHASARIQAGAPFALMLFRDDSLERKAVMRGAFPFLANKHALGLSFELRDHQLPTSSDLTPEIQQCLGSSLDKILHMCDGFPAESDEVFILRNFAIILPQLLFVYGTRTEQVRSC